MLPSEGRPLTGPGDHPVEQVQAHLPAGRVARARTPAREDVHELEPAAVPVLAQREVQLVVLPLEREPVWGSHSRIRLVFAAGE